MDTGQQCCEPAAVSEQTGEGNLPLSQRSAFMNYTYILTCRDGTLYTGWTNDLEKRLRIHNEGKGAKYTKSRRPVVLAYFEEFNTKQEAMRREWEIKQMDRQQKLELIRHNMQ